MTDVVFDLVLATRRAHFTGIERFGMRLFNSYKEKFGNAKALVMEGSGLGEKDDCIPVRGSPTRAWLKLPVSSIMKQLSPKFVVCTSFPPSPLAITSGMHWCRVIHDDFPWSRNDASLRSRLMFRHLENLCSSHYSTVFAPSEITALSLRRILSRDVAICGNAAGLSTDLVGQPVPHLPKRFLLSVGTVEPRKDYDAILDVARSLPPDLKIVIVGHPGWGEIVERARAADLQGDIIWLQGLRDEQLVYLYRECEGFLTLSHAEGFNMPLVEAGIFGARIICTDLPIHREVAAPWARFVQAADKPHGVLNALKEGLQGPSPMDVSRYKARFSWDNVASLIHQQLYA